MNPSNIQCGDSHKVVDLDGHPRQCLDPESKTKGVEDRLKTSNLEKLTTLKQIPTIMNLWVVIGDDNQMTTMDNNIIWMEPTILSSFFSSLEVFFYVSTSIIKKINSLFICTHKRKAMHPTHVYYVW